MFSRMIRQPRCCTCTWSRIKRRRICCPVLDIAVHHLPESVLRTPGVFPSIPPQSELLIEKGRVRIGPVKLQKLVPAQFIGISFTSTEKYIFTQISMEIQFGFYIQAAENSERGNYDLIQSSQNSLGNHQRRFIVSQGYIEYFLFIFSFNVFHSPDGMGLHFIASLIDYLLDQKPCTQEPVSEFHPDPAPNYPERALYPPNPALLLRDPARIYTLVSRQRENLSHSTNPV